MTKPNILDALAFFAPRSKNKVFYCFFSLICRFTNAILFL